MNEIGDSPKKESRWKRLRRAFLRTVLGNWILITGAGALVGAGLGFVFYYGTDDAGKAVLAGAIYGTVFFDLFAWLVKEKLLWGLVRGVTWFAGIVVVLGVIVTEVQPLWKSYKASRTATVRAVFLHPADSSHGPQVYMNDGTVWALIDVPEHVRVIQGDKVRYISESPPLQGLGYPTCELKDVTTGYVADAERLSAPFKRSSCPAQ